MIIGLSNYSWRPYILTFEISFFSSFLLGISDPTYRKFEMFQIIRYCSTDAGLQQYRATDVTDKSHYEYYQFDNTPFGSELDLQKHDLQILI